MLFQPFRFGLWARLAVVALVTGEAGGLEGGGGSLASLNRNRGGGDHLAIRFVERWVGQWSHPWLGVAHFFSIPGWEQIQPYVGLIALSLGLVVLAVLLWLYSDCIYRFILLDAVVSGHCQLREGWRRWRAAGRRYFVWVVAFGFAGLVLLGVLVGVPALWAYRAGWFETPDQNLGALIGWGVSLGLVVILLFAVLAIVSMFGRDFLVPVMAFEDVGALDGWGRLLELIRTEKREYAGYALMKIVLAMGGATVFSIVNLIVFLILLIPLGLLGLAAYFIGKSAGLTWDVSTGLLLAAAGLLIAAGVLYVIGFVYAPGLVFFQAYTLEFFAPRYGPLGSKMFPASPVMAPRPATPLGPMGPIPGGDLP